jgi:trimethylamine:corrinoid methyltransferase-like protein
VSNFREIIYQPVFANGRNYTDWSREKKTSEISAHEIVEERINAYREPDIGAGLKKQMCGYIAKLGVDPAKLGAR